VTVEAVRVLLEAMRVIIEAVRKIIEAVRLFVEAARVLAEAVRGLRSSANKSFPIDQNNFLRSRFHPVKFRAIIGFAWISRSFGLTRFALLRSYLELD
jgi:hypothetical protein